MKGIGKSTGLVAVVLVAILLTGCQGKVKSVEVSTLSEEDYELLTEAVAYSYEEAVTYDFPQDPINIEIMDKVGHYFIGFNYNVIEFSSDEACRTFSMDNGKELIGLICEGELKELEAIEFDTTSGEHVKCELDEWICVNGSSKIYPPQNWEEIVRYCEKLENMARE